jgi:hypothetical protein
MPTLLPDAITLRLLWSVIETLPPPERLALDEALLVRKILQATTRQVRLSPPDRTLVQTYLTTKVPLIRVLSAAPP